MKPAVGPGPSKEAVHTPSEAERVARARAGDTGAFRELVEDHRDRAFALALRVVRSREDAAEVAQDAFYRAWRALPAFRGEAAFGTWLYRIVWRLAADRAQALRARRRREGSLAGAAEEESQPAEEGDELLRRRLERLVGTLGEAQRAAVTLYYFQDRSVEEVARVLGMNENTVKTHLSRARAALRAAWMEGSG